MFFLQEVYSRVIKLQDHLNIIHFFQNAVFVMISLEIKSLIKHSR